MTSVVELNEEYAEPFAHSQFQPPSGRPLTDETLLQRRHVDAEIDAVGNGPAVDALFDFAAPVRQLLVFPAEVREDVHRCGPRPTLGAAAPGPAGAGYLRCAATSPTCSKVTTLANQ